MLEIGAERIMHDGNDIEAHLARQIARLHVMVRRDDDLLLLLPGDSAPWLADLCRLTRFHLYDHKPVILFGDDVDLVFKVAVIRGADLIAVLYKMPLCQCFAEDA